MRITLASLALLLLTACGQQGGAPDEVVSVLDHAGEPAAAPSPEFEGRWASVLETSVDPRSLLVTITLSDDSPSVILTAPDQGGARIAFEQVRLDGDHIGFATPLGALRFEGSLDGEDRIVGEVYQGGYRSTLVWTRVSDA